MDIPTKVPTDPQDQRQLMAKILTDEVMKTKHDQAVALLGAKPPGYTQMSEADGLALISRRWGDPMFRERLRTQIGDEKFLKVGEKLGYYTPPPKTSEILKAMKGLASVS